MPSATELAIDLAEYELPIGEHEREINEIIDILEVPLLTSLREEYGEKRGWFLCGPSSMLLGHFISALTGVPLSPDDTHEEHLQFKVFMYNPPDGQGGIDHTTLLYVPKKEENILAADREVTFIDPVGDLLWDDITIPRGAIRVAGYKKYRMGRGVQEDYNLYRFTDELAIRYNVDLWDDGRPSTKEDAEEMRRVMHDKRIFQNTFLSDAGKERDVSKWWGQKLLRAAYATVDKIPPGKLDTSKILAKLPPLQTKQIRRS